MATWQMMSFQDSSSPIMNNLTSFHNLTMMIIFMIVTITLFIMIDIIMNKFSNRYLLKNHLIETIWTFTPMIILVFICLPSLKILYLMDEVITPYYSIKAIGHQWYWSYEYSDFLNFELESFMINEYKKDSFRLLDTNTRMILPNKVLFRLIVTSLDVIHSWTVPSLGIKIDAIPGRINQTNIMTSRAGVYFGQCSEICGINHSFMPIVVESTLFSKFYLWLLHNI